MGAADVDFPASIQDIVSARFDRIPEPARRTLQVGAVVGRHFSMSLLTRTVEAPEDVAAHLEVLKRAELVHETQFFPEPGIRVQARHLPGGGVSELLAPRRKQRRRPHRRGSRGADPADTLRARQRARVSLFSRRCRGQGREVPDRAGDRAAAAFEPGSARPLPPGARAAPRRGASDRSRHPSQAGNRQHLSGRCRREPPLCRGGARGVPGPGCDKRNALRMHLDISRLSTDGYGDAAEEDRARRHLEAAAASVETDDDSLEKGLIYQNERPTCICIVDGLDEPGLGEPSRGALRAPEYSDGDLARNDPLVHGAPRRGRRLQRADLGRGRDRR